MEFCFNHGVAVQPRGFLGVGMRQNLPILASVHVVDWVRRLVLEKTLASVRAMDGDSLVQTCLSSLIFGIDARHGIERGGATNGPKRRCALWTEGVSLVSSGIGRAGAHGS